MKLNKTLISMIAMAMAMNVGLTSCEEEDNSPVAVRINFEQVKLGDKLYDNNYVLKTKYADFNNNFEDYGVYTYWDGFAYSRVANDTYSSLDDQYFVYNAGGYSESKAGYQSKTFAVAYEGTYYGNRPTVTFSKPSIVSSFYINNTAWVATAITDGFAPARAFVPGDWFKVTVNGYINAGDTTPAYSMDVYLADYRGASLEMITTWTKVNVKAQHKVAVRKIDFTFSSTDVGQWGMNTPAYCAIDDLEFILDK